MTNKILFFSSRAGSDFTMDAIWAGLVDRYGVENIIDYPNRLRHRAHSPVSTGHNEQDYSAERQSLCYTLTGHLIPTYTCNEINAMLRLGQIKMIFVDERQESYDLYCQTIARVTDVPVVVIAGHDKFWNTCPDQPLWILTQYYGKNLRALFIDNWRPTYDDHTKIFPMSYATNFDHLWEASRREEFLNNKVYDICFLGYNSHGDRDRTVRHIIDRFGAEGNCIFLEDRPNTVSSFLPKRIYFERMARSRICLNLRGAAECGKALRFYEIPYIGSYMLSQKFEGRQVHPFVNGQHCNYFSCDAELDEFIYLALSDEVIREKIARSGHEHALKFHTARARVDYIHKCLS